MEQEEVDIVWWDATVDAAEVTATTRYTLKFEDKVEVLTVLCVLRGATGWKQYAGGV